MAEPHRVPERELDHTIHITRRQARRFLLIHHFLWPPRSQRGLEGTRAVFDRLGSVQFDPINVTGRNPDLVLQSRVTGYRSEYLGELLYDRRELIEGWDKMASIFPSRQWSQFSRQRARMKEHYRSRWPEAMNLADHVLETLRLSGPLASNEFNHHVTTEGAWGQPARLVRICLNGLFESGEVGIAHRSGNRRTFDLIERLYSNSVTDGPASHTSDGEYYRWHMLRRIGSLGLARDRAGVQWSGIIGANQEERRATLAALMENGEVVSAVVDGLESQGFYLRSQDLSELDRARRTRLRLPHAAFLAPLDNLLWDRSLVKTVFDFDYVWEVYKPKAKREYGYYVLPILVGDALVGRVEPRLSADGKSLKILGWWWESGYRPNDTERAALAEAIGEFLLFLGAERVTVAGGSVAKADREWLEALPPG